MATQTTNKKEIAKAGAIAPAEPTAVASLKFVKNVEKHFNAELGQSVTWTPLQMTLAQHVFLRVDDAMRSAREEGTSTADWSNIDQRKLAIDSVHIVNLEIDASIKNHLNPIARWNSKAGVFRISLDPGFEGKLHAFRRASIDPILQIDIKLVFEGDFFEVEPPTSSRGERPIHKPKSYFKPGKVVIGGFGYIRYEDPRKDQVVIVTEDDFTRSYNAAQTKKIWDANPIQMREKTVAHRTAEAIKLDPNKINSSSFAYLEAAELSAIEEQIDEDIAKNANKKVLPAPTPEPEPDKGEEPSASEETSTVPFAGKTTEELREIAKWLRHPKYVGADKIWRNTETNLLLDEPVKAEAQPTLDGEPNYN